MGIDKNSHAPLRKCIGTIIPEINRSNGKKKVMVKIFHLSVFNQIFMLIFFFASYNYKFNQHSIIETVMFVFHAFSSWP